MAPREAVEEFIRILRPGYCPGRGVRADASEVATAAKAT
jgi:hypothetical protein